MAIIFLLLNTYFGINTVDVKHSGKAPKNLDSAAVNQPGILLVLAALSEPGAGHTCINR